MDIERPERFRPEPRLSNVVSVRRKNGRREAARRAGRKPGRGAPGMARRLAETLRGSAFSGEENGSSGAAARRISASESTRAVFDASCERPSLRASRTPLAERRKPLPPPEAGGADNRAKRTFGSAKNEILRVDAP